jgi:hypothetical protein
MKTKKTITVNTTESEELRASLAEHFDVITSPLPVGSLWSFDENGACTIIQCLTTKQMQAMTFDGSIYRIVRDMLELTPWSYLVITDSNPVPFEVDDERMITSVSIALQELGIIVIQSNYDPIDRIRWILDRDHAPKRVAPAREFVTTTVGERILLDLPGIGPQKLRVLLEMCGSVAYALMAITDVNPTGVVTDILGKKDIARIRQALELEHNQAFLIQEPVVEES